MKHWYDEELGVNMYEPDCVSECLFHIWAIGCDYDGYETVDGLKSLVDELVELANKARMFLDEGKYYSEECPEKSAGQTTADKTADIYKRAIKEFVAKLEKYHYKASSNWSGTTITSKVVDVCVIDNLVKEMEERNERTSFGSSC